MFSWQLEPDERPDIHQVISEINDIDPINVLNNFHSKENETTEKLENEDSNLPSCNDYDINFDKYKS